MTISPTNTPLPYQLRDYQIKAVNDLWDYFRHKSGNPCIVMPTASGKSIVIAAICKRAILEYPETRILMLTHVRELIEQNADKLSLPVSIYSAGLNSKKIGQITFAGIQSIHKRPEEVGYTDFILIDEAHTISHKDQGMYRTFISALKSINPKLKVIGLTATPYRLGHGLITDKPAVFDDLIEPVSIYELIKDGYLSPLTSKATKLTYDTSTVRKRGGEFIESELQKAVNTTTNNEAVVQEIISRSQGRSHWLIFCTGVKHSLKIRDLLLSHNITAATVTAQTPLPERDQIINDFKSGHITALVNVSVFTTGFDVPSVDLIALLRPTMSPGLYLQMVGRGMRISPNKTDCLILDFAGNVYTHGPIGSVAPPIPYSGDGIAPAKICPSCYEIIHAAFRTCPICSYSFPPPKPKPLYLRDDDISSGYRTHNIQEWRWNVHLARSGNTVLRCAYYPKTLSATPIYEYFAILSTGYGGLKAMQRLKLITDRLGVHLNHESLDAFCIVMNSHTPPAQVVTQRKGKYQEIVDKIWSTP